MPRQSPEPASRVGVAVICYNQARFVGEALDSVLAQTRRPDRVLCVDDASGDGSRDVIRDWLSANGLENRWETLFNPANRGLIPTLNATLRRLTDVDCLALVAADDLLLPGKLAAQVAQLEALPPEVGAVYSDALVIDESGAPRPERFIAGLGRATPPPEGDIFEELLAANFIPAPGALYRRAAVEAVGDFDATLPYEDWDYWLRFARRWRFAYTPEPTAVYRVVEGSMIRRLTREARLRGHAWMLGKHLGISPEIDARIIPRIRTIVYELHQMGVADPRAYRVGVRTRPRPRHRAAWALAALGVGRATLERLHLAHLLDLDGARDLGPPAA